MNIRKIKKLSVLDFFSHFKNMPMNFVPSFFKDQWLAQKKNLPASVFVPQLDPKTMLYKDILPVLAENVPPNQASKAFTPKLRPIKI
mmetsp:Transcript_27363/g.20511  ORF Transcript_27363/g.20511 Transcript_27363/m.20511 type:complete len:87 (+) Transcript_27363:250-510(+)